MITIITIMSTNNKDDDDDDDDDEGNKKKKKVRKREICQILSIESTFCFGLNCLKY